jgi:putative nucleotidyltransferase with HDIG domain
MQAPAPNIAVIHDSPSAFNAAIAALNGYFALRPIPLEKFLATGPVEALINVFCVNAGSRETIDRVKKALNICPTDALFVLPTHNSDGIKRLREITDAKCLVLPLDAGEFRDLIKKTLNRFVERFWESLHPKKRQALKETVVCFEKCFDLVQDGQPLPIQNIQDCCQHIRDAAELGDLDDWIDALDDHHDYSFRHSMFVCGTLSYFAHSLGIRGADLDQLTVGGLLHDIGKARIPLEILDKPGKLDDDEWKIMKQHPVASQEILLGENDLDADLVAMAVSHHEKIDGTGYPHGLSGAKINDHVRLTAIADVYSALLDKPAYKGSMTNEEALDMMGEFKDHLDMDLLRSFRGFVLDKG